MTMRSGLMVSLVLNVVWTTIWITHANSMISWYPEALHWPLTLVVPALINGLTFKMYFYQRFNWKDALIIALLCFVGMLTFLHGTLIVAFIYAKRGLNASFGHRHGLFLAVLAVVFYGLLWFAHIMLVYPLHVLPIDALPCVIQISIGLGMLNAVVLYFMLMLARRLGSPRLPTPAPSEVIALAVGIN